MSPETRRELLDLRAWVRKYTRHLRENGSLYLSMEVANVAIEITRRLNAAKKKGTK